MSGKYLFLTLLCTLSLALSACGSTEASPTATPPTAESEAAESEAAESEVAEADKAEADESEVETAEPEAAEANEAEADESEAEVAESEAVEAEESEANEAEIEIAEADEAEPDLAEIITETVTITEEVISEPVAGELTFPSLGNEHIPFGSRTSVEYNTTPPSSGPHYSNIIQWAIYDKPIPYELLVHNLEDGGVVVYYQCEESCPELVQQLTDAITPYLEYDWHVVMAPNDPYDSSEGNQFWHLDMGAKIAVVAWQKILKLDEFDSDAILLFLEAYEGIDHHKQG